jgi:hypothetical protein
VVNVLDEVLVRSNLSRALPYVSPVASVASIHPRRTASRRATEYLSA